MATAAGQEPEASLAVYGSLAPGESDHWVLARIAGDWTSGRVKGFQFEITWGPAHGLQGFIPDPDGHDVPVAVLHSPQLAAKWPEIDAFQGDGFGRVSIAVELDDGSTIEAQIHVAHTDID